MTRLAALLRRSLAARLSAAFVSVAAVALLVSSAVSFVSAERALRARAIDRLTAMADSDAEDLTFWVQRQRTALEYLAGLPLLRRAAGEVDASGRIGDIDARTIRAFLARVPEDVAATEELRFIGVPGGRVLASTVTGAEGSYATNDAYYVGGQDSTVVQRLYESGVTGRPTLTVATPVLDSAGRPRAVLAAHLDLNSLERVLLDYSGELPIDVYLVNRNAEFVSADRYGRSGYRRGVRSVGIDSALAGHDGSGMYVDYAGRPVVGVWRWLDDQDLGLLVETPQDVAFAPARSLLARTLLVGLLAMAGLVTLVVAIVRRATGPIVAVADAAAHVATGDFSRRAPQSTGDEVGRLAASFNAMSDRLQQVHGELNAQVRTTREALDAARESRGLVQDLMDHTTAVVLVVGHDLTVRLANARLEALLSLPRGAAVGRHLAEFVPPGHLEPVSAALREAERSGDEVTIELGVPLESGDQLWQVTVFPLRDDQQRTYAMGLLATDLSDRARAEEERRRHDALAQQSQKLESLGIMAGGIAHDFNNILGAVLGNADLALHSLDDRAAVREALDQIAAAARRASDLTRQMLAYAGRASLRLEVLDLRPVLQDVLALVRAAQSKKVTFLTEPMAEPLWVHADPAQLAQVALNLLTNAAEAVGDRNGTVELGATRAAPPAEARIAAGVPDAGRWIRLTVRDDGEGMTEEVQRRIFEPFFTTKRSGRGLGLSAVRGIIRAAGGVLVLESAPGRGSRFDVYLPESVAPAAAAPTPAPRAAAEARGRALVVDDELALRRIFRRALEASGLAVVEAADGVEALERFRESPAWSLVVLDLTMPGMGGLEVLRHIRAERADLPVIIASGYAESDPMSQLPADGAVRYLQKPFSVTVLRQLVDELLP